MLTQLHTSRRRCSSSRAYNERTQALLVRQLHERQLVCREEDQTDKIFGAVRMPASRHHQGCPERQAADSVVAIWYMVLCSNLCFCCIAGLPGKVDLDSMTTRRLHDHHSTHHASSCCLSGLARRSLCLGRQQVWCPAARRHTHQQHQEAAAASINPTSQEP